MQRLTFHVEGMGCRGCVRKVTARLRDVPGVETVVADAGSSLVHLNGRMTPDAVLDALSGTTYVAELRDDLPGSTS